MFKNHIDDFKFAYALWTAVDKHPGLTMTKDMFMHLLAAADLFYYDNIGYMPESANYKPEYMQFGHGGYPLMYIDKDNMYVCAECANNEPYIITDYQLDDNDSELICDACGKLLRSDWQDEEEASDNNQATHAS